MQCPDAPLRSVQQYVVFIVGQFKIVEFFTAYSFRKGRLLYRLPRCANLIAPPEWTKKPISRRQENLDQVGFLHGIRVTIELLFSLDPMIPFLKYKCSTLALSQSYQKNRSEGLCLEI
jgi:hypothetical protein